MPGAWSETKNATDEIQKICDQVKGPVEAITDRKYTVYRAVKYKSQVVAGENFLIKVDVGEDYDHLSVCRKLQCDGGEVVLRGVEQHRTKDAPLVPFTN